MCVLIVEDELYLVEVVCDGFCLEVIVVDIVGDGDIVLELLGVNIYDIVVFDCDVLGFFGDEIVRCIVVFGSGMLILMFIVVDWLDDKVFGFELGVDDYFIKFLSFVSLCFGLGYLIVGEFIIGYLCERL